MSGFCLDPTRSMICSLCLRCVDSSAICIRVIYTASNPFARVHDAKDSDRRGFIKVIRMMPNREAAAAACKNRHLDTLKQLVSTHFLHPKLTLLQVSV